MRPKTIGFFDDSVGPGGTTRYLLTILAGLDRDRFHPVFFAPTKREWHEEMEKLGVEIVCSADRAPAPPAEHRPMPAAEQTTGEVQVPGTLSWSLGTLREMWKLFSLFRRRRVEILHSNNAGAEPAPIAAWLAGIPVVLATLHVDSTYDLDGVRSGTRYRLLEKACMLALTHAISVSSATAEDWITRCALPASYRKLITIIHNGVNPELLQRRRSTAEAKAAAGLSGRIVVSSMGRLEPAKGYEYLIRALPAVVAREPRILLRIAGKGELLQPLEALARSLQVAEHVSFLGFTADIAGFLECSDIYIQPSLCEALPMAVLEAGAMGIPVIASDVGGVSECIRSAETGIIVPPRAPGEIARSLIEMAGSSEFRERMGTALSTRIRTSFRSDQMVESTLQLYDQLGALDGDSGRI